MRIFVTGAASPLGRALVEALMRRGHAVVGQVRRLAGVPLLKKMGAEPVVADVRRPNDLVKAMDGCQGVFHLARFFDFWSADESIYDSVNVDGTRHTVGAAILAGVPRFVFCSSALAIGQRDGEASTEWTTNPEDSEIALVRSQLAAERFVQKSRQKGIEVVTVNPSLVVAPRDQGWVGRQIAGCVAGRIGFASEQPAGWVWVGDVAAGLVRAFERGKDGERYILSGETLSPRQFLKRVARNSGRTAPARLPARFANAGAMIATALAAPFGLRPRLSRDEARFAATGFRVDGQHAVQELGVEYTPMFRYLPGLVRSYQSAERRFAS